jgi:hypothetical protein
VLGCSSAGEASAGGDIPENSAVEGSTSAPSVVAHIDFPDGRSLSFLEIDPGNIVLDERGPVSANAPLYDAAIARTMSPTAFYEKVAGAPAPASLVAAAARRTVDIAGQIRTPAAEETSPPKPAFPKDGIGQTSQALSNGLTTQTFASSTLCQSDGEFFHWLEVTGTGSVTRSDINEFSSAVMGVSGTVHWVVKKRRWFTWTDIKSEDIPGGWYDTVVWGWTDFDYDIRTTVTEADGDLYDMCTNIYK